MSSRFPTVRIDYLRPPDRKEIFVQKLLLDDPDVKITLAENVPFDPPIEILGGIALEAGSDAVWFTFPGKWHDIGRFHLADGRFTGIYANILTPPILRPDHTWETTDLFLDVWIGRDGKLTILDEDQLRVAETQGWIARDTADRAREEVRKIQAAHAEGRWPPPIVEEWTLERARQSLAGTSQAAERRSRST
jgi:predicted RNA-binding protein associated with RNAse of E/G family